jgi:predicted DNA-binding ribbon-helix-helix protein
MDEMHPTKRVKLNLSIHGRRTSLELESAVWVSLTEICRNEELSLDELCEQIVAPTQGISMASAIRIHVLTYFKDFAGRPAIPD